MNSLTFFNNFGGMYRFNPSHSISHKAMMVMLYLQFFAVQWALKYTFSPKTVSYQNVFVSGAEKKLLSVDEENSSDEYSKLRLNKRYLPESNLIDFHSFEPAPLHFTLIECDHIYKASYFFTVTADDRHQRGPPQRV